MLLLVATANSRPQAKQLRSFVLYCRRSRLFKCVGSPYDSSPSMCSRWLFWAVALLQVPHRHKPVRPMMSGPGVLNTPRLMVRRHQLLASRSLAITYGLPRKLRGQTSRVLSHHFSLSPLVMTRLWCTDSSLRTATTPTEPAAPLSTPLTNPTVDGAITIQLVREFSQGGTYAVKREGRKSVSIWCRYQRF